MHQILLTLHSINRWLVLISLLYTIFLSVKGLVGHSPFRKSDNLVRHITATIAHIQLLLGLYLYTMSPIVKFTSGLPSVDGVMDEHVFFRYVHILLMVVAVIVLTIGSAKTKRMETDRLKFRTMMIWYTISLVIILIAIPWPFSPLANRPMFRTF